MATTSSVPFSWDNVETLVDLKRLKLVFDHLPDQPIIDALNATRGQGRNDYPVESMWRALLAGIVFQHASIQSLLREMRRNPALLTLCGFNPLPLQSPPKTALYRELDSGVLRINTTPAPLTDTGPVAK